MAVGGRHIRHDWNTWVDAEQKSVRTMCGATTKRHLAGIPGVTDQPEVIEVRGKKYFGWCSRCALNCYRASFYTYEHEDIHPYILPMYDGLIAILEPLVVRWRERQKVLARTTQR